MQAFQNYCELRKEPRKYHTEKHVSADLVVAPPKGPWLQRKGTTPQRTFPGPLVGGEAASAVSAFVGPSATGGQPATTATITETSSELERECEEVRAEKRARFS